MSGVSGGGISEEWGEDGNPPADGQLSSYRQDWRRRKRKSRRKKKKRKRRKEGTKVQNKELRETGSRCS